MSGVKGKSGRHSAYRNLAIQDVLKLSIQTVHAFLKDKEQSLERRAALAAGFALKTIPDRIIHEQSHALSYSERMALANKMETLIKLRNISSDVVNAPAPDVIDAPVPDTIDAPAPDVIDAPAPDAIDAPAPDAIDALDLPVLNPTPPHAQSQQQDIDLIGISVAINKENAAKRAGSGDAECIDTKCTDTDYEEAKDTSDK